MKSIPIFYQEFQASDVNFIWPNLMHSIKVKLYSTPFKSMALKRLRKLQVSRANLQGGSKQQDYWQSIVASLCQSLFAKRTQLANWLRVGFFAYPESKGIERKAHGGGEFEEEASGCTLAYCLRAVRRHFSHSSHCWLVCKLVSPSRILRTMSFGIGIGIATPSVAGNLDGSLHFKLLRCVN